MATTKYNFTFKLDRLNYVITWQLTAARLRQAFVDAAAGEFGAVTVLSRYPSDMTGIYYRKRKETSHAA